LFWHPDADVHRIFALKKKFKKDLSTASLVFLISLRNTSPVKGLFLGRCIMANQQGSKRRSYRVVIPSPERMRRFGASAFGWIDARLLKDGWLSAMQPSDIAVYLFLCLVANQQGVSWYRRDRIREALNLSEDEVRRALTRLLDFDLVAYAPFGRFDSEGFRQVLSLPSSGPSSSEETISNLWSAEGR
jgi:hypothetical protein